MFFLFRWFTVLLFSCVFTAAQSERTHVTVLSTTDLHGHIYPIDYYSGKPTENGLAKVATLINRARTIDPDLILIDSGDTIQGTPLAYHAAVVEPASPHPMIAAMNALKYDAMAPGNHEYNFGLEVLNNARRGARFPWISANICLEGSEDPAYAPYIIKKVRGVKVGILGLTTPGVTAWDNPDHYAGLTFTDPVKAAHRWVSELRRRARVDVVVIAMHMGLEENILNGIPHPGQVPSENAAVRIAREVPGIDVILMGHTHREVPALTINGVLLTQAGRWGEFISRTSLLLERAEPNASWQLVGKAATTHPVTAEVEPDPAILQIAEAAHNATEAWLDKPIGQSDRTLSAKEASFRDTAIIDLIHRVQLAAGDADVSLAANFNPDAMLPEGELTVRDIAGLYVYENTLVVVELTGAELKATLEHSARYFGPGRPGVPAADLVDPSVPSYNFDIAEGVDYVIDLNRAPGDRIVDLKFNGRPLDMKRKLKVVTNNYRHNGGGGFELLASAPVISRSNVGIRDLIIEWVLENRDIPTRPSENWQIRLP
jgi:2',3'-cyclic-nucleotide 2'-phosphodiesterase (5'-nucleotidase family)